MIVYTPVNEEMLFSEKNERKIREVKMGNAILVIEEFPDQEAKIVRLISSDPADYLDPLLQPDTKIKQCSYLHESQ